MSEENVACPALIPLAAIVATVAVAGCGGGGGNTHTYTVPSEAMEPTIQANSTVDVDLGAYKSADPAINDIVVFNPDTVIDRSTFADPMVAAEGIDVVIVNGVVGWRDGASSGDRAGRFLRREARA
jgi:signal peptidase I